MSANSPLPPTDEDNNPTQATRRIRKKFNIYMSETSSNNPFGANSISSSYEEKRVFKYNMMKEYIKLTPRDSLIKEYEQSRYVGVMILGFVGGYFASMAITTVLTRGRSWKTNTPAMWDIFLYPLLMTGGFGYQYMAAQTRYNRNVCDYILEKYLPQAIENGFKDYQISK